MADLHYWDVYALLKTITADELFATPSAIQFDMHDSGIPLHEHYPELPMEPNDQEPSDHLQVPDNPPTAPDNVEVGARFMSCRPTVG